MVGIATRRTLTQRSEAPCESKRLQVVRSAGWCHFDVANRVRFTLTVATHAGDAPNVVCWGSEAGEAGFLVGGGWLEVVSLS